MKPVDLYWFSGTGNTLLVARAMAEEFRQAGVDCTLHRLEKSDPSTVNLDRILGIACTVACQSTYPMVWDFVRSLPMAAGTGVFLVDTLAQFSGGILGPMRRRLSGKGYTPLGAREILMPSNFRLRRVDPDKNAAAIDAGLTEAREFARCLLDDTASWRAPSWRGELLYRISVSRGTWRLIRRMMKLLADPQTCIRCGLCQRLCPVENIVVADAPPVFADRCVGCQRCFAFCPTQAIRIGKKKFLPYTAVSAEEILGRSGVPQSS